MMTLPNILTMGRIALVPPFIGLFYLPGDGGAWAAFALFALAAVTDYFDGWLARRLNQTSEFGRILDPIADKLIVSHGFSLRSESSVTRDLPGRNASFPHFDTIMADTTSSASASVNPKCAL